MIAEFAEFVSDRSAALLRWPYLLSADRAAAEDVVQTALVRAYLRWDRIAANPEAYVRRVVVTVAADERRRPYRRREVADRAGRRHGGPGGSIRPAEVNQRLRDGAAIAPAGQRAAVVLRHWVGLEPAEVAPS